MTRPLRHQRPSRREWILQQLQIAPITARQCANTLGCPEASVRREMSQLRRHGHQISPPRIAGGFYCLENCYSGASLA